MSLKQWYTYSFKYDVSRAFEKLLMNFVWRLPKKLVYWCAIRVIANATTGEYSRQIVPDLTVMDALQRWDNK